MKKGISLIALIITIIVIIILAVITIFGVNGVIEKAREAKILQEISNEKEIVSASVVQAKKEVNNFNEETLGKALNNITGVDETYVFADSDNLAVQFKNSERYYLVNKDGVIEGPVSLIEDEYAGDITKNGKYDGSAEKPYQITCIEDLVAFSIMTNGGNSSLGLKNDRLNDKYVELAKTLDFQSIFSYSDYTTEKYGDLNKDTLVENIQIELTKTDEGCIGFTPIGFSGFFDGKNNTIKNLYMEDEKNYIALFYLPREIKNLSITGEIIGGSVAAGLCTSWGGSAITIRNCKNYANIVGTNFVGGIASYPGENSVIENCENYGMITVSNVTLSYPGGGGILGRAKSNVTIKNCKNFGNNYNSVEKMCMGGIIGCTEQDDLVELCENYGNGFHGGICGAVALLGTENPGEIRNCINFGECNAGIIGHFGCGGGWSTTNVIINNCYNVGKVLNAGIGPVSAGLVLYDNESNIKINNCYSIYSGTSLITSIKDREGIYIQMKNVYYNTSNVTSTEKPAEGITGLTDEEMRNQKTVLDTGKTLVEILNENIGDNADWKKWAVGANGYPTFVAE